MAGSTVVPVTLTEFLILRELARSPYRACVRETLAAAAGTYLCAFDHEPPSPHAVDLYFSQLGEKLSRAGYDCISTMRFVGYRFVLIGAA